jgi:hypothetical protein
MPFGNFFVHTVSVSRLLQGSGVQSVMTVVDAAVACNIQPVTAEYAQVTGMVYGRTYNGYFDLGADIQISDVLVDQQGKRYQVTGTLERNYSGEPHITALLSEQPKASPDQ